MSAQAGTTHRATFRGALTLRTAEESHARLLTALRDHAHVEVDCTEATEVDVSFVQLLVAARRTAAEWGKSLTLAAPAQGPLCRVLERGGFLVAPDGSGDADGNLWNQGSAAS